jgi:hypothetical protein
MLDVAGLDVTTPTPEEIEAGARPEIIVTLFTASETPLPIADPSNPGQPIVVPLPGPRYRFRLDGEGAEGVGARLIEAGSKLPRRSRIETATSLVGVQHAAANLSKFKA